VVRERGGTNILVSRFCVYIVPVFLIINKLVKIFYYGGILLYFLAVESFYDSGNCLEKVFPTEIAIRKAAA